MGCVTGTCKDIKYTRLEIRNHTNFQALGNFKPSDLLGEDVNSPKYVKNERKPGFKQKGPLVLYLPRTKPDNFPKLNNLEFEIFCKKRIKFINYYVISAYFFNNPTTKKNLTHTKLHQSLKNLKLCKDFFFFNHYQPFVSKDILQLRRSSLGFMKTVRLTECEGPCSRLYKDSQIQVLNIDFQRLDCLAASLRGLKLKRIFQPGKESHKVLDRLKRLKNLEKLNITIEDYRKILENQEGISKAIDKLHKLKEIELGLTFMVEKEDIFGRNEEKDQEINLSMPFWRKITGLHISDDDIPLDEILYYVEHFKSLKDFSYYGEPKFREDFDSFQNLSRLPYLKRVYISISMMGIPGHTGASFFEKGFLPPTLEEFTLRIELQRLTTAIEKAIISGKFFENINKMASLKYFLLSIGIEGEEFDKRDHKLLSRFFSKIVKSLTPNLEDLMLMVFGFQKLLISEDTLNLDDEELLHLIPKRLPNLKNLFVKFSSINTEFKPATDSLLPNLHYLNIEGPLPVKFIEMISHNSLEEVYCQTNKRIDLEQFIAFLRGLNRFDKLRVLNIRIKALSHGKNEDQLESLNMELFIAIVNLFRNLKLLNDFSLRITSISIEKKLAEYLLKLCEYKKTLQFCSLEFDNCEIFKEYFTSFLSEGDFSTEGDS